MRGCTSVSASVRSRARIQNHRADRVAWGLPGSARQLPLPTGTLHFLEPERAAVHLPWTQEDPPVRKGEDARGAGQCAFETHLFLFTLSLSR